VAWVTNPRFPDLKAEQVEQVLKLLAEAAQERFGRSIKAESVTRLTIERYFEPYTEGIRADPMVLEHMLPAESASIAQLAAGLVAQYEKTPTSEIRRAVEDQPEGTRVRLARGRDEAFMDIAEIHIRTLKTIAAIRCQSDGEPLIAGDLYNEYMAWHSIAERQTDYDLVITNQLFASVESYFPCIHQSLRGGIVSGFAPRGPARHGGVLVVGVFPLLAESEFFREARGGDYDDQTVVRSAAYIALHEFGHLLMHRGHQFAHPGCVMRPPPGLRYREWVEELVRNGPCLKEHEPASRQYYETPRSEGPLEHLINVLLVLVPIVAVTTAVVLLRSRRRSAKGPGLRP